MNQTSTNSNLLCPVSLQLHRLYHRSQALHGIPTSIEEKWELDRICESPATGSVTSMERGDSITR